MEDHLETAEVFFAVAVAEPTMTVSIRLMCINQQAVIVMVI